MRGLHIKRSVNVKSFIYCQYFIEGNLEVTLFKTRPFALLISNILILTDTDIEIEILKFNLLQPRFDFQCVIKQTTPLEKSTF